MTDPAQEPIRPELSIVGHRDGGTTISVRIEFDKFEHSMKFIDVVVEYMKALKKQCHPAFIEGYFNDRVQAGDRLDPATGNIVNDTKDITTVAK